MVMDETGRNGENWHLAQQITHHVIMRILSMTTTSTTCNQTTYHAIINDTTRNIHMGGNFLLFITKYKIPPNYNNLQFVNK